MTVADLGKAEGRLEEVVAEITREDGENEVTLIGREGVLAANLQIGAAIVTCQGLRSNSDLSNRGFCLFGSGFIVEPNIAKQILASSRTGAQRIIWKYRNGKDLTNRPRGVLVIDGFPFTPDELRSDHPGVYQHLLSHVKPERDHNSRASRRELWWAFGEPNKKLRDQLNGLTRYIATVETSKHRFFTFLEKDILPDNMLVVIASDDAAILGILSSRLHILWALAQGGTLEDRPRYNKSVCFDPFPFPDLAESPLKQRIRDLGERLDAHRKARQAAHPHLTLTGMYNVLEKLRSAEPLTPAERKIHDDGLVTLLQHIHDDLDAAVLEAYGWSDLAPPLAGRTSEQTSRRQAATEDLLARLVALNHARAAEERNGHIRWLRPEYQAPRSLPGHQTTIPQASLPAPSAAPAIPQKWPSTLAAQVAAIQKLLPVIGQNPTALAAHFGKQSASRTTSIAEILETLRSLGKI